MTTAIPLEEALIGLCSPGAPLPPGGGADFAVVDQVEVDSQNYGLGNPSQESLGARYQVVQ